MFFFPCEIFTVLQNSFSLQKITVHFGSCVLFHDFPGTPLLCALLVVFNHCFFQLFYSEFSIFATVFHTRTKMACLLTRLIEKILYLPPKRRYISNHPRFNNNYHETYAEFRSESVSPLFCSNSLSSSAYGEGKIAYYHLDRKMPLTILYLHGNAEDLASMYVKLCSQIELPRSSYLHWLSYSLKVDIISFDYPGYGQTRYSPLFSISSYTLLVAKQTNRTSKNAQKRSLATLSTLSKLTQEK